MFLREYLSHTARPWRIQGRRHGEEGKQGSGNQARQDPSHGELDRQQESFRKKVLNCTCNGEKIRETIFSMNILFMDDNQQRCDTFAALLDGSEAYVDIATTHTAAMQMLANHRYDAVFLDHDLDGMHYADSNLPNTGYQVAKFITGMDYDKRPGEVVIHSWNPAGTAKMFLQLSMYPPTVAAFGTRGFLAVVKDLIK